jgi:hypothetical protein
VSSPEVASLVRELAEMQRQLRDLAIGNPLNSAEVVDAAGNSVLMSNLAFGQVGATDARVGAVALTGPLNTDVPSGSISWTIAAPAVTVLVTGGRLRVDWAALLAVQATTGRMVMSNRLTYTGPKDAPDTVSTVAVAPNYYRSIMLNAPTGAVVGSFGTFSLHTGLTPGWYRIDGAYGLLHGSMATTPAGSVDHPRISATPY